MTSGDYNVICDRTGFKVKRSQCVKEWMGMLVYRPFAESRHVRDRIKPRSEPRKNLTTRPEQPDIEIDPTLPPDWDSL